MPIQSKPKVLFVCSMLGARAYVACFYSNRLSGSKMLAIPAGFQRGYFGRKIRNFLASQGIALPAQSPKSVFEHHREQQSYDYIVTLCNDAAREQCPIFRKSIETLFQQARILHWYIADFESIEGEEVFILSHWEDIVTDIEKNVRVFVDESLKLPVISL